MIAIRHNSMFRGFHVTMANGYTLSVQFGEGNYCDNRHDAKDTCANAEIAVWGPDGKFVRLSQNDNVKGWVSPDEIAETMVMVAQNPEALSWKRD